MVVVGTSGTVLVVVPVPPAVVLVVVVSPGVVVVVGVAHCERSTMHPAQRAQSGCNGGVAVAASHRGTDSPLTIGHSQVSAQSGCTTPSPQ